MVVTVVSILVYCLSQNLPNEIRDASAESMKAQKTIKKPINERGSLRS